MKKRILCSLILSVILCLSCGALFACTDGEYTVEFYVDGKLVETERTINGEFSYSYPKPDRGVFKGWFTDSDCTKSFTGGHKVSKNTKLYGYVLYPNIPNDGNNFGF